MKAAFLLACLLSPPQLDKYLAQDYWTFDQSRAGWRAIGGCDFQVAQLVDVYHLHHLSDVKPSEGRVLHWHAGQLYAMADRYAIAIRRFETSLDPLEPAGPQFPWNSYARATIAFLRGDRAALLAERAKLAQGTHPGSKVNLKVVDGLIKCFGKPYREAYGPACRPS